MEDCLQLGQFCLPLLPPARARLAGFRDPFCNRSLFSGPCLGKALWRALDRKHEVQMMRPLVQHHGFQRRRQVTAVVPVHPRRRPRVEQAVAEYNVRCRFNFGAPVVRVLPA